MEELCSKFEQGRVLPTSVNRDEIKELHLSRTGGRLRFRFPPEPNGYLHIGHAKSMSINFGMAKKTGGTCYLRYDDTNPEAESQEYIDAIREAVEWLGWSPDQITYSSDYFETLYYFAERLIEQGDAYVDNSTLEEIREQRHLLEPSPCRNRKRAESLSLFREMRRGQHKEASLTLRLRCGEEGFRDENPNLRDPVAYRIRYIPHHRTGDKWCIYPSYDFTHGICDSLEEIDYSICTLEFETRREIYYWILDRLDLWKPYVFEFSRLNIEGAVLSKRKINDLVKKGDIDGWSDPRLLTILGMRRRGYTPNAINLFCEDVGVSRTNNVVEMSKLTHYLRQDLDLNARRVFGILRPLRVILTNYEEKEGENNPTFQASNHPKRPELGTRTLSFGKTIYIERSDFRTDNLPKYWRLAPGKTVGLKYGPNIICDSYTEENGQVVELQCRVDFEKSTKPKAHIHWIAEHSDQQPEIEIHLYTRVEDSVEEREILSGCYLEKGLITSQDKPVSYQFERMGYFTYDPTVSSSEKLVFHQTVELKSSY